MSDRAPKYLRALQAFADDLAAAIGVQFAITTEDGAVELATSATSAGVHPSIPPVYDAAICRIVWPARESTPAGISAPFYLPDGSKRLLWTSCITGQTCDPPTIARLFQQHLVDLQQHRNEVDDLAAQLLETYEEMNLFYELADAFEVASDDTQVGSILLTRALEATSAQAGAVVLLQDSTPTVVAAVGALSAPFTSLPLQSFPLLETTLQSGIAHNLDGQRAPDAGQPDRPTIIAPVLIKHAPVGALVLQKSAEEPFAAGEMMLARSLSTHAGVFLNNLRQAQRLVEAARLQQQVEFAHTVQRQLLPAMDMEIAGLDIAVAYLANNQVGGDYYDIFDIAPHTVCAVIADVSGHSIASGLLMTAARSALQLLVRHASQPAKILQQLNETLYRDLDQTDLFMSLFLVVIDLEAEVMHYASAGHNPALLYRRVPHDIMPLEATGFLMGLLPDASFDEIAQPFQRGDALVLYTDGITEARNPQGECFGEARLQTQVRRIGHAEARGIVGSIMTDVRQHTRARPADDMTLLVLKLAERGAGMTVETANVTVPGRLASISRIRHWLQDVLSEWAVSHIIREDLALAVTELCTNIARHGYSNTTGDIEVHLTHYTHAIHVTILDSAPFFIPEKIVPQPPVTLAEGGYGLFLIEALMDEVRYERRTAHRNRTVLVKYK